MSRRVFLSFDYENDAQRVSQIRHIGVIEGQPLLSANEWEQVRMGGEWSIRRWINRNMRGCECVIVLIGAYTADSEWVRYEIEKGWNDGLGVLGIHIHGLKDLQGEQDFEGDNPFVGFTVEQDDEVEDLEDIVPVYDPPFDDSKQVYGYIRDNVEDWVEEAIDVRSYYD